MDQDTNNEDELDRAVIDMLSKEIKFGVCFYFFAILVGLAYG